MQFSGIKNGITNPVGSVNPVTKTANNNIKDPATVSALSQGDTVTFSTSNRFTNNKSLQDVIAGKIELDFGAKGDDVLLVQNSLQDLGFFVGEQADGKYGNQSVAAVKNFQSNRLLPQTGIVDKNTLEELDKIAPPPGKKLWDKGVLEEVTARSNDTHIVPSNQLDKGKTAQVVIDLSEHRLFYFNKDNSLNKVYSIASGKDGHIDGRGGRTSPGLKKVTFKDSDPTTRAAELWPETKGTAFGTKLLDLSWYDQKTGKTRPSGEELHGTFASSSIGTDASHGCMRLLNKDVEELFPQIKVGDLVKVQE